MMEQNARDIVALLAPQLAGRTVALVGNAQSLSHEALGHDIDGCDLVVRLNSAPGCGQASHGSRTDWLASSMFPPGRRIRRINPGILLWMSPRHRVMAYAAYGWRVPLVIYPVGFWRTLCTTLGARPSTGAMAVDLLTRCGEYAELRLYGFDFFQSGSLSQRNLHSPPPHDFERERSFILDLLGTGNRMRLMRATVERG